MMKAQNKKPNFLEWNNSILASSLKKINLNVLLIVFLDALFYLMSGYAAIFWMQRIQAKMASFSMPSNLIALAPGAAKQLAGNVRGFYYLIIISFLLLLIAIIFLASILKGIIWAKTTGTKISFRLISRFFAVNIPWIGFWIALAFLIAYLAEPAYTPALMAALAIAGFYFTNTLYSIFMKEQGFKSILRAVRLCISKFHIFLLPYAAILLLLYALIRLGSLLKFSYSSALFGIALLFYAAVVRYYASALALEAEKGLK
jgi:hypothetical protein